jgi:hypothetical protein
MNDSLLIPQGEQTITVELTVKQAIALSGYRFNGESGNLTEARRKVMRAVNRKLLPESEKLHFHDMSF